jgi:hypothetical protein
VDLERRACLPPEVGGARPRSTTSNLEATIHRAQQGLQSHKLEDLENAYNKVDIGILARKIAAMEISDVLIRWVLAMLEGRKCCMKFGTWRSEPFQVCSGLPHGYPLGSVLVNIYTADIATCVRSPTTVGSIYVDNIIAESEGNTQQEAVAGLQDASYKMHM